MRFLIGFVLSCGIACPAYLKKWLSLTGALSAILLGTLLYGAGTPSIYLTLIAFFVTSSIVSKVSKRICIQRAKAVLKGKKGSRRDHTQVFCNGGIALMMTVLFYLTQWNGYKLGAVIAIAVSCSDTWASEIGVLSKNKPVYLFKRTPVPTGLSGGVTCLGHFSALAGAIFVAMCYGFFEWWYVDHFVIREMALVASFGFLGAVVDSFLGEFFQAQYQRDNGALSEVSEEGTGTFTLVKGYAFVTNNGVNLMSNAIVVAFAILVLKWVA